MIGPGQIIDFHNRAQIQVILTVRRVPLLLLADELLHKVGQPRRGGVSAALGRCPLVGCRQSVDHKAFLSLEVHLLELLGQASLLDADGLLLLI